MSPDRTQEAAEKAVELQRIPNILTKLNQALTETRSAHDILRAERIVPYIRKNIDTAKALGATPADIDAFNAYLEAFSLFLAEREQCKIEEAVRADRDFIRNRSFIENQGFSARQEIVRVNGTPFKINIYAKDGPHHQNYLVIHDSEDSAFDIGIRAIENGGTLVALESGELRNLSGTRMDPNRIFLDNSPYQAIGQNITQFLGSQGPIISLHNNDPGHNSNGGRGNFDLSRLSDAYNNIVILKGGDDLDNAVWISSNRRYRENTVLQSEVRHYVAQGMNVVYEYVPPGGNDSSLSNWAALQGRPYYNIEIEAGNRTAQQKYLEEILKYREQYA